MNTIKHLLVICLAVGFFTGCGMDNFEQVKEKTEVVLLELPFAVINANDGGGFRPTPLEMGKRNMGNGPNVGYVVDMNLQNSAIEIQVLMKERINQNFTLNLTWRVIDNQSVPLVLNYFPTDKSPTPDGKTLLQQVAFPMQIFYQRNIQPHYDMVSRDVVDEYRSSEVDIGVISATVKDRLVDRLVSVKIPKAMLDPKGQVYYPEPTVDPDTGQASYKEIELISVNDVIEIVNINIPDFSNPEVVNTKITEIQEKKAELADLQEQLAQMETRRKMEIDEANHAKAEHDSLNALLANRGYLQVKKMRRVKGVLEEGKARNTTVILAPKGTHVHVETGGSSATTKPVATQ